MGKKSTPKAPTPPDPYVVAGAQSDANLEALQESAKLNRYDQTDPYGSVTWDRKDPNDPSTWSQTTSLNPEQQALFDQQNQIKSGLNSAAAGQVQNVPTDAFQFSGLPNIGSSVNREGIPELASALNTSGLPQAQSGLNRDQLSNVSTDFSGDTNRTQQAVFDRAMGLMNPQFDRQQRQLETSLANKGLPMGGEAYSGEMDRFSTNKNNAQLAAALDAVQAGSAENSRLFGQSMAARQQGVGEQMNDFNMATGARNQGFNEQVTANQMNNQARQQGFGENQADLSAAQFARQQGASEQINERNQLYSELSTLLNGGQPGGTAGQPVSQYSMTPPDISGAMNNAYMGDLNNWNTQVGNQQAQKQGYTQLAGAALSAYAASDRRLKKNINRIGSYKNYNVYSYNYNWSDAPEIGVMADEVKLTNPDAVVNIGGYDHVKYGEL